MNRFRLNRRAASVERQSFRKPIGRYTKAFRRRAGIVDDDMKAQALLDYLKEDGIAPEEATVDEITVIEDGKMFGYDGYEYIVGTSDEAHDWAIEDVKNLFDDMGIQSFSESFQEQILNDENMLNMSKLKDMMGWEIDDYVNSMDEEEVLNSLESFVDNPEEIDEDERYEVLRDEMASNYAEDPINRWYKQFMSDEEFSKYLVEQGLLDVDAIAEEVVRVDGCANSLAGYDGEEIDLGNDLYAYRWN